MWMRFHLVDTVHYTADQDPTLKGKDVVMHHCTAILSKAFTFGPYVQMKPVVTIAPQIVEHEAKRVSAAVNDVPWREFLKQPGRCDSVVVVHE